jgi:peptide-methionine (S)-S-oxide reductase
MRTAAALFALLVPSTLLACRSTSATVADTASPLVQEAPATPDGPRVGTDPGHAGRGTPLAAPAGHALAAFAEGCFWGSEDSFRHVPGVVATAVGYSGGHTDDPSYEDVCSHTTGHAETVLVEFDPQRVSYDRLLEVFFATHDPTTKDRQGPDVGDQYRSAVFTFSPDQEASARAAAGRENAARGKAVTTEIKPIGRFWKAEAYHQQYDEKTGRRSCPLPGKFMQGT